MKRLAIGFYALCFVLAYVYLATDDSLGVAKDPAPGAQGKPIPLFNSDTQLEPATVEDTPTALVTRVADRGRDRHAREGAFKVYEHFIAFYFEFRTSQIEIVDTVAKGGDSVTFNMTSLVPLHGPNLRAFFEGKGTPAQYSTNTIAKQVDPLHYTQTFKMNTKERRPIKIGDRIEFEWSIFLDKDAIHRPPPSEDRIQYYGTPLLYVVGTPGIQPWEGIGPYKDSFPLPETALSGGLTTSHQNYSNEPTVALRPDGDQHGPDRCPAVHDGPAPGPHRFRHRRALGAGVIRSLRSTRANSGRAFPQALASTVRRPCRRTWASR